MVLSIKNLLFLAQSLNDYQHYHLHFTVTLHIPQRPLWRIVERINE